jgi:hypothetical protein
MTLKRRLIASFAAALLLTALSWLVRSQPDVTDNSGIGVADTCTINVLRQVTPVDCNADISTAGWQLPMAILSDNGEGHTSTQTKAIFILADFALAFAVVFLTLTLLQRFSPGGKISRLTWRRLELSLLVAIALAALSLLYRTGPSGLEPMPYTPRSGNAPVIDNGFFVSCPLNCPEALSNRGWPYHIVSLITDEDKPQNYYRGFVPAGLARDLAIYFAISLPVVWVLTRPKKPTVINGRPVK